MTEISFLINKLFSNINLKKSLIVKEFDVFIARLELEVWLVAFVPLVYSSPDTSRLSDLDWFHLEYRVNIEKVFGEGALPYHKYPKQKFTIPEAFPIVELFTIERTQDGIKYVNPNIPDFEVFLLNDPRRINDRVQYPKTLNLVRAVLTHRFTCTLLNKKIRENNIVYL
jgi:hypothetical protein